MSQEIVLITGASSGFGYGAALELAKRNFYVIATMRNTINGDKLIEEAKQLHIPTANICIKRLDVTVEEQINNIHDYINQYHGKIDILINNAGYSQGGFVEHVDMVKWKKQFETNFFGVVAVTRKFIPMMRIARKGKIINIGSISGRIGLPGMSAYAASKFALAGFSESLRHELKPFHVYTTLIEAGSFQTNIWEKGLASTINTNEKDYQQRLVALKKYAKTTKNTAGKSSDITRLIAKICEMPVPQFRYQKGRGVKSMIILKSLLRWSILEKWINRYIYKS